MSATLEEIAVAADATAKEQREIAHRARGMQRQRDRGWSWTTILDRDKSPGLVDLARRSARRAGDSATALSIAVARALSGEGESRRQIARRVGVTHQRVSAMLNGRVHRANHD